MSTTREQTTQTEATDSPNSNTTIANSFLEKTAVSTSLSAAKSSAKEPTFPSGLLQVSEEAGMPAVQTFYAVKSDNLARRKTHTPVTLQGGDKPLSLPGESYVEDSGAAHNVATKTVRFSNDLLPQASETDSSPVYEMNTLDTSQDIASFQVLTDSEDNTIKISEPNFDNVLPKQGDAAPEHVEIVLDTASHGTIIPKKHIWLISDACELYFHAVEAAPTEVVRACSQTIFTEPRVTSS